MGFPYYSKFILYLLKILHIIIQSSIILVNEKFCQLSVPNKVAVLLLYYTSSSVSLWRVFFSFNICIFNSLLWLPLFSLTFDSLETFASIYEETSALALMNKCTVDSKLCEMPFLQYQLTDPSNKQIWAPSLYYTKNFNYARRSRHLNQWKPEFRLIWITLCC